MLCCYPLEPEPTDVKVAEERLARSERRLETAGQSEEQVDKFKRQKDEAKRRIDLLKRADEIIGKERAISAARRTKDPESLAQLQLELDSLISEQRTSSLFATAVDSAQTKAAASLSKPMQLLSDRQRARYFSL